MSFFNDNEADFLKKFSNVITRDCKPHKKYFYILAQLHLVK